MTPKIQSIGLRIQGHMNSTNFCKQAYTDMRGDKIKFNFTPSSTWIRIKSECCVLYPCLHTELELFNVQLFDVSLLVFLYMYFDINSIILSK